MGLSLSPQPRISITRLILEALMVPDDRLSKGF